MSTIPLVDATIQWDDALLAAAHRALVAHPDHSTRIAKGFALVKADAVIDCTKVKPGQYQVRSETCPTKYYDVTSNGQTMCTCLDASRHGSIDGYLCKHAYSVLLVRSARRNFHPGPRMRHAHHWYYGEGYAATLPDGNLRFHPGGHAKSYPTAWGEVTLGQYIDGR